MSRARITAGLGICATSLALAFSAAAAPSNKDLVFKKLIPKLDTLPPPKKKAPLLLKGNVDLSAVKRSTDVGSPFGFAQDGPSLPATVSGVVANSPAWRGGMQVGDRILFEHDTPPSATLVVERKRKRYQCRLVMDSQWLGALAAAVGDTPPKPPELKGAAEKSSVKVLVDHAIVLVIDSSASMGTKDCPDGLSRWEWCRKQTRSLYLEGQGALKNNISIVMFDSHFRSFDHCKISDLGTAFQNNSPSGETYMAPPLQDALASVRSQIYAGRPAVVAVISDGRPTDSSTVKSTIIDTANSLRDPALLTITFIEIGTPEKYLKELDNDLVNQGAHADIVTVVPFSTVNSAGLAQTLASAITKTRVATSDKLTPQQVEVQRLEAVKRVEAADKVRRSAANQSYSADRSAVVKPAVQHAAPPPVPMMAKPAPPIKAHPSGTAAPGSQTTAEVDEKENALKQSANRTYTLTPSR